MSWKQQHAGDAVCVQCWIRPHQWWTYPYCVVCASDERKPPKSEEPSRG